MKRILEVAAGVIIGMSAVHIVEYYIVQYQVEVALQDLAQYSGEAAERNAHAARESLKPDFETREITVAPETKIGCLQKSAGIYNDTYLTCRQGRKMTVRQNRKTGEVKILTSEPILDEVNVL